MNNYKREVQVPGQIGLFEYLAENFDNMPSKDVGIKDVIDISTLSDFSIHSTYRDIFLIINMLDDYVRILKGSECEGNYYTDYMISQFERISRELSEQIRLDKEAMYRKCQKRKVKDDIGEDAMILASKKGAR